MNYLLVFMLVLVTSLLLTYAYRLFAIRRSLLDIPNARSSHDVPTPHGGGVALIVAWYALVSFLFFNDQFPQKLFYVHLAGLVLVITGFLDDLYDLPSGLRFLLQAVTAFLALYFLGGLQSFDLGFWQVQNPYILNIIAFFTIIWFINLFNFLDGIDGYLGQQVIVIGSLGYAMIKVNYLLFLVAAVLGFLIWNWPRAKIFMGDVGSTFLGFLVIILGIYYENTDKIPLILWLPLSAVFWFDATYTLFRRWLNKEKLTRAHKKHAYQRLTQAGFSHQQVSLGAFFVNVLIGGGVYICYSMQLNNFYLLFFCIMLLLLMGGMKYINRCKPFE